MALVVKNRRCSNCGSSEISEMKNSGTYYCRICGSECDHLMDDAVLERIMRVQIFGGTDEEIAALRNRYPHLGIATRSFTKGLEID